MTTPPPLPALFIGHGSPMNALERNRYTAAWQALGHRWPKPRAVLCVSAHWFIRGTAVTADAAPRTIHDFHGFPDELQRFSYPAAGSPELAHRVQSLLADVQVPATAEWGLDHGTWSVLAHVFPDADVPVVQLSLDASRPAAWHYATGQRLSALRDEGILLVGSGNVVHNLGRLRDGAPWPWATAFNDAIRTAITVGDHASVVDYPAFGEAARLSVPTPEHFLPLLYVLGARREGERASIAIDGIELASISMMSVVAGG